MKIWKAPSSSPEVGENSVAKAFLLNKAFEELKPRSGDNIVAPGFNPGEWAKVQIVRGQMLRKAISCFRMKWERQYL